MNTTLRSLAIGMTLAASMTVTRATAFADPAADYAKTVASVVMRLEALEAHVAALDRRLNTREAQTANGLAQIGRVTTSAPGVGASQTGTPPALTVGDVQLGWKSDFDRTFNTLPATGG